MCAADATPRRADLQRRVDEHPFWYHTIDIAPGVTTDGRTATEPEGDEQRDGREGIGEVVDRVRKERDRARQHHDRDLDDGRAHEGDEGHLDRPDPSLVALQRRIDGVGRVVAVRPEHLEQRAPEPTPVFVSVVVRIGVAVRTVVVVTVTVVVDIGAVIVVVLAARVRVLGHAVRLPRRWCSAPATA